MPDDSPSAPFKSSQVTGTGTMQKHVTRGKLLFGFIQADDDANEIFVLPDACEEWAGLPPVGSRLMYDITESKKGKPMAINVKTLPGSMHLPDTNVKTLSMQHMNPGKRLSPSVSSSEGKVKRQKRSGVLQFGDRHMGDDNLKEVLEDQ